MLVELPEDIRNAITKSSVGVNHRWNYVQYMVVFTDNAPRPHVTPLPSFPSSISLYIENLQRSSQKGLPLSIVIT
jgi:hypothetical protein